MKKAVVIIVISCWLVTVFAAGAMTAQWPTKPITVIVPWAAGGMTDIMTRLLVERFKSKLGQPVVVSNQGGAAGITGMLAIMSSKPDGYTFGSASTSSALGAPYLLNTQPFDLKKFSFIGGYGLQERIIFAPVGKPYKTWQEFVAYARKNPGKISVGSGGVQWALDVVRSLAKKEGLKLKYVMFKSGGEASTAIMGGHVDLVETGSGTPAYQAARQGKLVALIDLGNSKDPNFPALKNVLELGYPFSTSIDYGMVVPARVPEPIRAKLEKALKDTLEEQAVKDSFLNMGINRKFTPGSEYETVVKKAVESIPKLADYIKDFE